MKIRIPIMIQDPSITTRYPELDPIEGFDPVEDYFLDGPVSEQIAILDFSPETGELVKGAKIVKGKKRGNYRSAKIEDLRKAKGNEVYEPEFLQVSTFATILKTMYMLKDEHILGRSITWANGSPQLLVIPRAGKERNAFYHRDSNSLQFFMFPSGDDSERMVYTCLYRDVVSHETGHALVDGIAPDLFDAQNPDGLAMHEAIADLTALMTAIGSHNLRRIVLDKNDGKLDNSTDFSTIADDWRGKFKSLRDLNNEKSLDPSSPKENYVKDTECHARCEVLGGALYNVLLEIFEDKKKTLAGPEKNDPKTMHSVSGGALVFASDRLKQMIFRALDYLAPGDVSFADFGRAIVAVDTVAYPKDQQIRDFIKQEFRRRYIVKDVIALEVSTFFDHEDLKGIKVSNLVGSDWAAYNFVSQPSARSLLCIPTTVKAVEVLPRLDVTKKTTDAETNEDVVSHECIFKVGWDEEEDTPNSSKKRRFKVGTTLAIEWETGKILALLTNAPQDETNTKYRYPNEKQFSLIDEEQRKRRESRNEFYDYLDNRGLIKFGKNALDPEGLELFSFIHGEDLDGKIRLRGSGKMLHMMERE